jgi:galactokinase
VAAGIADVAQAQISTLASNVPNAYQLKALAASAVVDQSLTDGFARLTAAGFGAGVTSLATPTAATGTDAAIRTQIRAAFDALVAR